MPHFYAPYHSIKPYLINDKSAPEKEQLQLPGQRDHLNGLYECVLCGYCASQCLSFWWNPEKFRGAGQPVASRPFHRRQSRLGDLTISIGFFTSARS